MDHPGHTVDIQVEHFTFKNREAVSKLFVHGLTILISDMLTPIYLGHSPSEGVKSLKLLRPIFQKFKKATLEVLKNILGAFGFEYNISSFFLNS